jgi:hypothetical protein
MNGFGQMGARLEWEATPPGCEVDFLELHIRLDPTGSISTRTSFQKPMNLYLYRPPTSAQPSSNLYNLIYGTLHWYYWHNTDRSMFEQFAWKFFQGLQQQGHAVNKLAQLFLRTATQVDTSSIPLPEPATDQLGGPDGTCFLVHLQCHLQDTPHRTLRQLFTGTCAEAFEKEGVPVSCMTIPYKQSSNIAGVT